MDDSDHRISELERRLADADRVRAERWMLLPVSNDGSGDLTVSRYRKVLERLASGDEGASANVTELAQSDVGPLLFPAFDRFILPSIRSTGGWEKEECQFLRSKLKSGMSVLDVGANVGYTAVGWSPAWSGPKASSSPWNPNRSISNFFATIL